MQKDKKIHDTITIGVIAGIIATIAFILVDWVIANLLGVTFTPAWAVAADIFLTSDIIYTPIGRTIGYIAEFALGASLGIIVAIILRLTGMDYYIIKGLGTGFLFWIGSAGIARALANIAPFVQRELSTNLVALINFIILGIISSMIIAKNANFQNAYLLTPQPAAKRYEDKGSEDSPQ